VLQFHLKTFGSSLQGTDWVLRVLGLRIEAKGFTCVISLGCGHQWSGWFLSKGWWSRFVRGCFFHLNGSAGIGWGECIELF